MGEWVERIYYFYEKKYYHYLELCDACKHKLMECYSG